MFNKLKSLVFLDVPVLLKQIGCLIVLLNHIFLLVSLRALICVLLEEVVLISWILSHAWSMNNPLLILLFSFENLSIKFLVVLHY
jgi:hypothetical protein